MFRSPRSASSFVCVSFLLALAPAQELSKEQFRTDFSKAVELNDEKMMDKTMKRGSTEAPKYYEETYWEKEQNKPAAAERCQAVRASWQRVFDKSDTIEQLDRWLNGAGAQGWEQLQKGRRQSTKLYSHYFDVVSKGLVKAEYEQVMQQFMDLAKNAESFGHSLEVAELWNLASVVGTKMPDKSITNRRDVVFASEQFLEARKRWNFTFDVHYIHGADFVKHEKAKIEVDEKAGDKRKDEGYDTSAKGVDSLVMPNVAEAKHALKFEALAGWDELDYGTKTGPLPAFWWMASMGKVNSNAQLSWFRKKSLYMHRTGAAKAALAFDSGDAKNAQPIDISSKGKVSSFFLDADKKMPYAMVFWTGSDREMVNAAECNLSPGDNVCNVYYRSAASWKTTIGTEVVTLYDDNASGTPGESNPFEFELKVHTLGAHDTEGTPAPLLDSMRVGKGPRQPFSEFVKLATGWVHLKKHNGDELGLRPLNPEYVKTGKIKLVWSGNKPTVPVQLVVRGTGDYQAAMFDVGGGKEVEVPAAEYGVLWGRIVIGKGSRAQVATIYAGASKPFTVEAGKAFELKMGAPFALQFVRRGDENANLDALKILLNESSGCLLADLHGISLACEVLASKDADGKSPAVAGKFVNFTDPELVNKAAGRHNNIGLLTACFPMPDGYRDGEMVLKLKLAAPGMKLALSIKKHPLFGDVKSAWQ
ncbi:MAG: hypothetical protein WAT39_10480 [Planctomycetota bacterium]